MPLYSTLNDLKEDIRRETERRNNAKFEDVLPRIIASAEHRIYHGAEEPLRSEPLRIRVMEISSSIALVDGAADLPDGYLQMIRLDWDGSPRTSPTYEPPHEFFLNRYVSTAGSPVRYTLESGSIYVSPKVTGDLTVTFYQNPGALEDDTDTNDVLTAYPMIYFYAGLVEAYSYLRNPTEMQKAFGNYVSLLGGLMRSEGRARVGYSTPLAPRIPGARI
jgi:hypothetical protein